MSENAGAREVSADPQEDREEDAPPPEKKAKGGQDVALLGGEIEILPDQPLPHLNQGIVKAYAARKKGEDGAPLYAIVCERHLVPRSRAAGSFAAVAHPGLVQLVGSGPVFWPPDKREHYVFVYTNSLGEPLMASLDEGEGGLGWRPDFVMNVVIKPMIGILTALRNSDLVHGSIRPTNMFSGGRRDTIEQVMLGPCLSAPASFSQPLIMEPAERMMADPAGRGPGEFQDDIYAFGASLAIILRKRDPLQGMSLQQIIEQKIEVGSYNALIGNERFTGAVLELLRGLLYDDPAQRWTLDEIHTWADGQRLSPKQTVRIKKGTRPLNLNNNDYYFAPLFAMDLETAPDEALSIIEGPQLAQWLSRSLNDDHTLERVEQVLEAVSGESNSGPNYRDSLLCRISAALHPEAPLRFRGLRLFPDGIGEALAAAAAQGEDIQAYPAFIQNRFIMYWLDIQQNMKVDPGSLISRYDTCRAFLGQKTSGYGLERCIYFLSPECPCLSDKLEKYYVRTPEDMMRALNDMAEDPKADLFMDRHMASFLAAREKRDVEVHLVDLNAEEPERKILANLKIWGAIQKKSRLQPFPVLAGWFSGILDPVYETYHDRELRETLKKQVAGFAKKGDLTKIAALFENTQTVKTDDQGFRIASREYAALAAEHHKLKTGLAQPKTFGKETGREIAAILSGALAGVIILIFTFMAVLGGGF